MLSLHHRVIQGCQCRRGGQAAYSKDCRRLDSLGRSPEASELLESRLAALCCCRRLFFSTCMEQTRAEHPCICADGHGQVVSMSQHAG